MSRIGCPECGWTVTEWGGPGTALGACPRCRAEGRGTVALTDLLVARRAPRTAAGRFVAARRPSPTRRGHDRFLSRR